MFEIESSLYNNGHKHIACIDEVGRGCLFGDVVACSIILPYNFTFLDVKDSKKLSAKKREFLYEVLTKESIAFGIGRVPSEVVDEINIKQATRLAMKLAFENMKDINGESLKPSYVLIDAEEIDVDIAQRAIIDGDNLVHGIAAASIVAKVFRDRLCIEWDSQFPGYELAKNKGYGTKNHIDALKKFGATELHRKSFLNNIIGR